jgi:hypothetical protein
MIIRPAERWLDPAWSLATATGILQLVSSYKDALLATFHFKNFELIVIAGLGRGRNWIEMLAEVLLDVVAVIGLWPIALLDVAWWAKAGITLAWVLAIDVIAQRKWLAKYGLDPLIRRIDPRRYSGWTSSIIVLGALVREEVIRHIRRNLNVFGRYLETGLSLAGPNPSLSSALKEAKTVRKNMSSFVPEPPPVWKKMLDKVPWDKLAVPVTLIGLLSALGFWNGIGLCLAWVLAYHVLAWLGVPFFESALRKQLLFEGMFTTTSDGIELIFTGVAQQEAAVYRHLGISQPSAEPWVLSAWPFIHYIVMIAMIVGGFFFWRRHLEPSLSQEAVVFVFGANILIHLARALGAQFKRRKRSY